MAFVKLDCGILTSTLWIDKDARIVFITSLLMAEPYELTEPMNQIKVRELTETGFVIPPGWYGLVDAAGVGIVDRSGLELQQGLDALERLGSEDPESRTSAFGGRRMCRIDGGYIILNYDKYRSKDHTAAERSRRYRERKLSRVTDDESRVADRSVTQADADADTDTYSKVDKSTPIVPLTVEAQAEAIYNRYPKKVARPKAIKAIIAALKKKPFESLLAITEQYAKAVEKKDPQYIPYPASWFNAERFNDSQQTWNPVETKRPLGPNI